MPPLALGYVTNDPGQRLVLAMTAAITMSAVTMAAIATITVTVTTPIGQIQAANSLHRILGVQDAVTLLIEPCDVAKPLWWRGFKTRSISQFPLI